jgi:hypothetical protein
MMLPSQELDGGNPFLRGAAQPVGEILETRVGVRREAHGANEAVGGRGRSGVFRFPADGVLVGIAWLAGGHW